VQQQFNDNANLIVLSTASIDFRVFNERKVVTALCVGGSAGFLLFFVKSQDPKGKMEFERTPDIPVIAGDGITYGVACLQFLDSSLEV
jgi:hypothetical protein